MTEPIDQTEQRKNRAHRRRSATRYLLVLFTCAILLLLLAYFTEQRPLALSAAHLVAQF